MKALITGASSGIGADMARILASKGCDLIIVARRESALKKLAEELNGVNVRVIALDLSQKENCMRLHDMTKDDAPDILINNAGFGVFGEFTQTDIDKDIALIDTNVTAVHILTKLFAEDFVKRDSGYILNVASSAAFTVGPLMASYYASKAYVFRLTQAVREELRRRKSKVVISVLCPGPVETEFNDVAGVKFAVGSLKSRYVADYALKKLFKGKAVIVPGAMIRFARIGGKLVPDGILTRIGYNIQKKKDD